MNPLKTSASSPLYLAEVHLGDGLGMLGLTLCPGKKDPGYGRDRDLDADLASVARWGTGTVLTLIEDHEFRLLAVEAMEHAVRKLGMDWMHLPIRDVDVLDIRFEIGWRNAGPLLHARLEAAE